MNRIGITTDCVCDLPDEYLKFHDVEVVYFYITTGTGRFKDGFEITSGNILEYLENGGEKAETNAPAPEEYRDFFLAQLEKYNEIIHISISDKISLSYHNAKVALTYLEGNDCDAVLLDINMPEMDGFEVLEKIRRIKRCQNLPVIFLTADNDSETEARCFYTGAVDFIAKPFVPEVMRSRISRVLELEELRRGLENQVAEKTAHIHYIKDMMVLGMAEIVESRDSNTGGHIKRTSEVIKVFSQRLAIRCFASRGSIPRKNSTR